MKEIEQTVLMTRDRNAQLENPMTQIFDMRTSREVADILQEPKRSDNLRAVAFDLRANVFQRRLDSAGIAVELKPQRHIQYTAYTLFEQDPGDGRAPNIYERPPEKVPFRL
jgi:hypothetical protein